MANNESLEEMTVSYKSQIERLIKEMEGKEYFHVGHDVVITSSGTIYGASSYEAHLRNKQKTEVTNGGYDNDNE